MKGQEGMRDTDCPGLALVVDSKWWGRERLNPAEKGGGGGGGGGQVGRRRL